MSADIVTRMRADAEVAGMRRRERAPTRLRPPHIRPWGIAVGAQPARSGGDRGIWWGLAAAASVALALAVLA